MLFLMVNVSGFLLIIFPEQGTIQMHILSSFFLVIGASAYIWKNRSFLKSQLNKKSDSAYFISLELFYALVAGILFIVSSYFLNISI